MGHVQLCDPDLRIQTLVFSRKYAYCANSTTCDNSAGKRLPAVPLTFVPTKPIPMHAGLRSHVMRHVLACS